MSKYWIRSRFFNNGNIAVRIFLESEAFDMDKSEKETDDYLEYWDCTYSYEEAVELQKVAFNSIILQR